MNTNEIKLKSIFWWGIRSFLISIPMLGGLCTISLLWTTEASTLKSILIIIISACFFLLSILGTTSLDKYTRTMMKKLKQFEKPKLLSQPFEGCNGKKARGEKSDETETVDFVPLWKTKSGISKTIAVILFASVLMGLIIHGGIRLEKHKRTMLKRQGQIQIRESVLSTSEEQDVGKEQGANFDAAKKLDFKSRWATKSDIMDSILSMLAITTFCFLFALGMRRLNKYAEMSRRQLCQFQKPKPLLPSSEGQNATGRNCIDSSKSKKKSDVDSGSVPPVVKTEK